MILSSQVIIGGYISLFFSLWITNLAGILCKYFQKQPNSYKLIGNHSIFWQLCSVFTRAVLIELTTSTLVACFAWIMDHGAFVHLRHFATLAIKYI